MDEAHSGLTVPTVREAIIGRFRPLTVLARHVACFAHHGQTYGDQPYAVHLQAVAGILTEWGCDDETVAAGWLHDVLEDTTVTWDTLLNLFGRRVAWMVEACTGEGETRREKAESIRLKIIHQTPDAAVVKLADRIANVEAAQSGTVHERRYQDEHELFAQAVYPLVHSQWAARLDRALDRLANGPSRSPSGDEGAAGVHNPTNPKGDL